MIPLLDQFPAPQDAVQAFLQALKQAGFRGDIDTDAGARTVYATDNSIYQVFPQAVLSPKDRDDLVLMARLSQREAFRSIAFCPRGGGTSTNGQSLTQAIAVDFSRHMNRVLHIDPEKREARVQPGVVKDQLNDAVKQHGLFFAPDTSTSNRATIGGMISTDAAGQGSRVYGKTRDHVTSLEQVLIDGTVWESGPVDRQTLDNLCGRDDRVGNIYRTARRIANEHADTIRRVYPPLSRAVTGYDFAHLQQRVQQPTQQQDHFDLNSLLCGSEGTLGLISEATVKLSVRPTHRAVITILYQDFIDALRDAPLLQAAIAPTSIECLDNVVVDLAKNDPVWSSVREFFPENLDRQLGGVSFVEFEAHSDSELARALSSAHRFLEQKHRQQGKEKALRLSWSLAQTDSAIGKITTLRKKSVGLLGKMAGAARPVPFVEDSAVPPEHLADYIAEFRQLLDRQSLKYGMFGHGDAGVIHVRPALNLREPDTLQRVRQITDQVVELTEKYHGVLWGEHGKGIRSQYSPDFFGDFYPQLQKIKAAFDPHNQLNPGKLATPPEHGQLIAVDQWPTRGARDAKITTEDWQTFESAVFCNGNGACFDWNTANTMCPSYKATGDRQYSPKGRAMLIKEWLAQLGEKQHSLENLAQPKPLWRHRLLNAVEKWRKTRDPLNHTDFSRRVYQSMDQCLACKACATQCPVQVNVPDFRSRFLFYYFSRYARPLRHHIIGALESLLPLAARTPRFYNLLTQSHPGSFTAEKLLGLTAMPAMHRSRQSNGSGISTATTLSRLSDAEKQRAVILLPDIFTRYFDTSLLLDIARFLQATGFIPFMGPCIKNGKPQQVLGMLDKFQHNAHATAQQLNQLAGHGIPLVGVEPSMSLIYRDEYQSLPDKPLTAPVLLLQEWLAQHSAQLEKHRKKFKPSSITILMHCTEAAASPTHKQHWQQVMEALGQTVTFTETGCCGMAGTYGHESKNRETSRTLYDLSWRPVVESNTENNADAVVTATGFSCRSQAERFSQRRLLHPVQAILQHFCEQAPHDYTDPSRDGYHGKANNYT